MKDIKTTACFTGHRPKSLPCLRYKNSPDYLRLRHQLKRLTAGLIEKKNVTHFITGAALGVDMLAAEIVLELKREYSDITIEAAVPCRSQADRWSERDREQYNSLLSACDKVTLLSEEYTPECMMNRNRYMVDNSAYVLAVWNGLPSGTGKTVKYAAACGREVFYVDAESFHIKSLSAD